MKGSDYIAQFIESLGTKHAFVLTGGACAHIIDSLHTNSSINIVCCQHEQAAAMAAECYSRLHTGLGVAVATSGPGATNLLTGIACAWFDSIPVLYVTGQVNTFESKKESGIRQMGFQETDIVSMTASVTKFAGYVSRPEDLRRILEEAVYWARQGRPGPVLVDVPFNVQTADVDPACLQGFAAPGFVAGETIPYEKVERRLCKAQRPVLLVGGGVKCAHARTECLALAERLQIPIVASWSGLDVIPADHPLYRGQIGVYGARAANFTVQNADFLLSIGSRLDSRQTGGKAHTFAREAFRVIVDVDREELHKGRVYAHLPICADAKAFCAGFLKRVPLSPSPDYNDWVSLTRQWVTQLPIYCPENSHPRFVNPYRFLQNLAICADTDAIAIADTGATLTWTAQAFAPRGSQRLISALGNSPMGYALPAAIGAHFAQPQKQVLCLIGDGGLQLNLQELQTLVYYQIPVKVIILNNSGYGIIKQFQDLYLEGRHIATGEGYSCPSFGKLAQAYGIAHVAIERDEDIESRTHQALAYSGPLILEVCIFDKQRIEPKLGWGKPIEDSLPLLPRDQFAAYMLIDPLEEEASIPAASRQQEEIN